MGGIRVYFVFIVFVFVTIQITASNFVSYYSVNSLLFRFFMKKIILSAMGESNVFVMWKGGCKEEAWNMKIYKYR